MAVTTTSRKANFFGLTAGVPVTLSTPIFATSDIVVTYLGGLVAVLGTHYTVTIASDNQSAQITPTSALIALIGTGPILVRAILPLTQDLNIPQGAALPERELTKALDKAALRDQQLQDEIDNFVSISINTLNALAPFFPTTLPSQANQIWNNGGVLCVS